MLFSSMIFMWVFLPIVILGNYILSVAKFKSKKDRIRAKNIFLLIASLIFYAWGGIYYVLIMIGSILLNYVGGLLIGEPEQEEKIRLLKLVVVIVLNIGILFVFKYFNMFSFVISTTFHSPDEVVFT